MYRLVIKNEKKIVKSRSITFLYIDDILSLNKSQVGDYVYCTYHYEQKVDTTNIGMYATYFDFHIQIDSYCRLRTELYKSDDFKFSIVTFNLYVATFQQQHVHMEYICYEFL